MNTEKLLLTERQVAGRLGVPAEWLRKEAEAGRVPFIRVGRRRLYVPQAIMDAINTRAKSEGVRHG